MDPSPDWSKYESRELNKILSPIRWSPAKDKQEAIDHHVAAALEETRIAREEVPCKLNIPYGASNAEQFDIYGTDLGNSCPVFLWVHGGAWLTGHKDWSGYFIRNVYSWGFRSIIVGYPLAPDAKVEEMCIAIHNAVGRAMSLFPRAQFVIGGHSAGAHLVTSIICGNNPIGQNQEFVQRIAGFALFSGLFDVRPVQRSWINEALSLSVEKAQELSPLVNVDKIQNSWLSKHQPALKILVGVGEFDPPEFIRQSKEYSKSLLKKGFRETRFWVSDNDDHFTIIENFKEEETGAGKMLKQFLLTATTTTASASTTITSHYKKSNL